MSSSVLLVREYLGTPPPPGIQLPTAAEIFCICPRDYPQNYNRGLAYPSQVPVFWIKHGGSITWNELEAQSLAQRELQKLSSPVRAPALFYACELKVPGGTQARQWSQYLTYMVMEYIPGKTAEQWLEDDLSLERKGYINSRLALALSELIRILVPDGQPPSGIDGGKIFHCLFEDLEAPFHYTSVQQIEDHMNEFLSRARRNSTLRVKDLALEPMVFCYSDLWLQNFIISLDGSIAIIDFFEVSFLPACFFTVALRKKGDRLKANLTPMIIMPETNGIDNTDALMHAAGPMIQGSSSFVKAGYRLFGKTFVDIASRGGTLLFDSEGRAVEVTLPEKEPTPPPGQYLPKVETPPELARFIESMGWGVKEEQAGI